MSDSRNQRRLNTLPSVDARRTELYQVLDAGEESVFRLAVCASMLPEDREVAEAED